MSDWFINGFPEIGERVEVTRKSGAKIIARLGRKGSIFRSIDNYHWLDDDDKFVSVGSDPVVSWSRVRCDLSQRSMKIRVRISPSVNVVDRSWFDPSSSTELEFLPEDGVLVFCESEGRIVSDVAGCLSVCNHRLIIDDVMYVIVSIESVYGE